MDPTATEVPSTWDDFNPERRFAILFNLGIKKRRVFEDLAQLMMVWEAPALPQHPDIISVGTGVHQLAFEVIGGQREWVNGRLITMDGQLLKPLTPREFLDRMHAIIEASPENRHRLHASLHIFPADEMLSQEAATSSSSKGV